MNNLINVLGQQLKLLEELHSLLKRETNELAEIHLDTMAEINSQKENVAARIEVHSAVLRKAIDETAASMGLSSKVTLGELAIAFKQKGNKEVSRLHKELNRVVNHTRETISINREIAERFAASVTSSLELLTRVVNQSNTYGASGSYQQRPTGAVLFNREA